MEVKGMARSISPRPVSPNPLLMSLISESKGHTTKGNMYNDKSEPLPVFSVSEDNIPRNRFSSLNDSPKTTDPSILSLNQSPKSAFQPVTKKSNESNSLDKSNYNESVQSNFRNNKDMESYRQFVANPRSSLATAPSFLNLVRAKLEEEKARSERPKLQRKITEHDDPLYALVVKETLLEYEQKTLKRQETLKRQKNVIIDDYNKSDPPHCEGSPDFLDIMERKIAEKAAEVMPSIKSETVIDEDPKNTVDEDSIIKESAYASVLLETLRDYEKLKNEQDVTKKVVKSFGFNFREGDENKSPNFLSLLEQKLIEKKLIDMNITSKNGSDGEDSIGALIVKGALLENRNRGGDECTNEALKAEENNKIHPHHINRPFWSDTTEDKVISTPAHSNEDNIFEKAASESLKMKKRLSEDEIHETRITRGKSLDMEFIFPNEDNDGTKSDDDGDDEKEEEEEALRKETNILSPRTSPCMPHEIMYKGNDFSRKYTFQNEPLEKHKIKEEPLIKSDVYLQQNEPNFDPFMPGNNDDDFERYIRPSTSFESNDDQHQYFKGDLRNENKGFNVRTMSNIEGDKDLCTDPLNDLARSNSQNNCSKMQVIPNKSDNLRNTEYETEQEVSYNSNERVYTVTCRVSPRPQRKNPPTVIIEENPLTHHSEKNNNPEIPTHIFNEVSETNAPPPPIDRSIKPKTKIVNQTQPAKNSLQHTFIPPPDYSPISSPTSNSDDENIFVDQFPLPPPALNDPRDVWATKRERAPCKTNMNRPHSPCMARSMEPIMTERKTIKIVEEIKRPASVGANRLYHNEANDSRTHQGSDASRYPNNDKVPLKSHHFAFIHGQKGNPQSNFPAPGPIPDRTRKPMKKDHAS